MENVTALLFYSPECDHCNTCLTELEPYADRVRFVGYVNIHEIDRSDIPASVTRVPCLVLGKGNVTYTGYQVYEWIRNLVTIVGAEAMRSEQKELEATENAADSFDRNTVSNADANAQAGQRSRKKSFDALERDDSYVKLDELRTTFSDEIDYSKMRMIEPEAPKPTLSLESILEKRNSEIAKLRK